MTMRRSGTRVRPKRASADEAIDGLVGGTVIDLVVMAGVVDFDADVGAIGAKRRGVRGLTGLTFMPTLLWAGERRG